MVSYSAKLDSRTKQHTQFEVSVSNGSRDMARTKVAKKNEHGQNYIASPTGIANNVLRTHTHILLTTGLVRIWLPTRHWEIDCSLKETQQIYSVFCL